MTPIRQQTLIPVCVLIAIGCLLLALVWPGGPWSNLAVGLLLGTLYGQTAVAGAWNVFGPALLVWRLPLSVGWLGLLLAAFGTNVAVHDRPQQGFLLVLSACVLGQWALGQMPLWLIVWRLKTQLHSLDDPQPTADREWRQFDIRQLMIVTVVVAVVLGIGRYLVLYWSPQGGSPDWLIFIFLSIAAIAMTVPLILATLLPRHALAATAVMLLLIGVATLLELPALRAVGGGGGGPEIADFAYINLIGSAWIVTFALSVRLGGYGLGERRAVSPM
jgi:hypothetical protein